MLELSPVLTGLREYPFGRLSEAKASLAARGVEVIDFGIGEPREPTPPFIRRALAEAVLSESLSTYPAAVGSVETRLAISGWCATRFGIVVDPETEVVPTLGAKEAVFHLAQLVGPGAVAVPAPGYPVYERGARFAGREVIELPLTEDRGWLPSLEALPREGVALVWLNFPGNPTAATASLDWLREAAALARARGWVLACDEAYSELWFAGDPPASVLQLEDRTNVLAVNTLSKRSSMPGFRCGFVAGDPALIAGVKRYRPNVGVAPQAFVQAAAVAAWSDEAHVVEVRERYRAKRDALLPALLDAGFAAAGGDASFFLWLRAPDGLVEELLELGLVIAPGSLFGPLGEGYARLALVPTLAECVQAARVISSRGGPR